MITALQTLKTMTDQTNSWADQVEEEDETILFGTSAEPAKETKFELKPELKAESSRANKKTRK